jgi:hypothetical protein
MRKRKWTYGKCEEEALKYNKRKDFETNSKAAYAAAYRNGWVDGVCSHMKRIGNKLFRCIYVYEFPDNYVYIGLTFDINNRNNNRKYQNKDAVTKHIKNTEATPVLKQLSEYIHIDVVATLENDVIEHYKNNGWNLLNKAKGGAIGCSNKYWTKELCQVEALKFNTRNEFYSKNNKAYTAAQRYGWLNDICSHMVSKIHHWTFDECKTEALKYNSRNEFQLMNKAAYTWAIRKNMLDDICSHMCSMVGNNQYSK